MFCIQMVDFSLDFKSFAFFMVWTSLEGFKHSGDLKLGPFKIWKNLKSGLFEGPISNGWASAMAIAVVPTIQNPVFGKTICPHFECFHISEPIQNLEHLHATSKPLFYHSKSRLVWISDPHFINILNIKWSRLVMSR